MLHKVKAQRPAEPLSCDEGLDPAEDLGLAGPVLVVDLHRAAGVRSVQVDLSLLGDHVASPLISLHFDILHMSHEGINHVEIQTKLQSSV